LHFIFETHAHADHISGAQLIKKTYPQAQIAIGANITKVQSLFKGFFNLTEEFAQDGSQFDRLLTEDETLRAGALEIKTLFTPGHTPACVSLLVNGKALFTGDTLFMPDYGTGRCDFPAGSSEDLYESITQKLYTLPDETRVYVGHDYQPHGRALQWETTIGASKAMNIQLNQNTSKDEFVSSRDQRDAKLAPPKLLFPSVEININAGRLPEAEGNGRRYLKIPIEIKETVSP
jgi:glyoxylase-like metal-dependent hydrolase (beta-lactamase superfamily II)